MPKNALEQNPASAPSAVVRVELAKSAPSTAHGLQRLRKAAARRRRASRALRTAISHAASTTEQRERRRHEHDYERASPPYSSRAA